MAVADHLVRQSQRGCKFDPRVTVAVASSATGLSEADVRLGILDLVDAGLMEWTKTIGSLTFYPLPGLFVEFDPRFLGLDNESDAVAIANWLVNEGRVHIDVEDIAKTFPHFPDRRLNSALGYLEGAKTVRVQRHIGSNRSTYSAVSIDDRALRFVKN